MQLNFLSQISLQFHNAFFLSHYRLHNLLDSAFKRETIVPCKKNILI